MLMLRENLNVYVWLKPIDMRKSINGLTALVFDEFEATPQSEHLFLFYNKKKDKVKIVYWDRNGFVLHYKRLDKGRFKFKKHYHQTTLSISENQLNWLLAGLDFQLMNEFNEISYTHYY